MSCRGVITMPQGNPHQPRAREKTESSIFCLSPHLRQQINISPEVLVMKMADQTL